jgi:uncharacterized delta-60 repeat protein
MRSINALLIVVVTVLLAYVPGRAAAADRPSPSLDRGFGDNGYVATDSVITDLVVLPDDRILVAGRDRQTYFAMVQRLTAAGALDPAFGVGGRIDPPFSTLLDFKRAPNGRLVMAGLRDSRLVIAVYTADGQPDTAFNGSGWIDGPDLDSPQLAFQDNDTIVVGGSAVAANVPHFTLVRYNRDGSLDRGFGDNGTASTTTIAGWMGSLKTQPDGKLVAAGGHETYDFLVARYTANGVADPTFGDGGTTVIRTLRYRQRTAGLAIQPDGKLILVGISGPAVPCLVIERLQPTGTVDPSFSGDGSACDMPGPDIDPLIQADGAIITGALLRYRTDGRLDTAFAGSGIIQPGFSVQSMALQSDGKLLAGGDRLARYIPGDSSERCFPETGQCSAGRLMDYWQTNGALPVFGYPIAPAAGVIQTPTPTTPVRYLSQWFERNRLEIHPENTAPYDVLLGLLGNELLIDRGIDWRTRPRDAGAAAGCLWFEETGRNVCDQAAGLGFKSYWSRHGLDFGDPGVSYRESLALFGLPLTAPSIETNANGDTVLTQWFERARFEWHPDKPDEFKVLLGLLGKESQ